MSTSRRCFLQASAAFLGAGYASAADSAQAEDPHQHYFDAFYHKEPPAFRFDYPFDGGILQEGYGYPVLGSETGTDGIKRLKVHIVVRASDVSNLEVVMPDGQVVPTSVVSGQHMGTVLLKDRITPIRARGKRNGKQVETGCRVVWAKKVYKRYRCYIDDHSFFFRDILQKNYKSLFDCFYLGQLRELNRRYQTKFNLNCFNSTPERDFNLSMFPDKYKSEFEDNADWLRLAFHAENEFPNEPYREAPPEKLAADFDLVAKELKRIAGKAYTPGLQIHWAMVRADSYKVLAQRGVRMLPTGGRKNPGTGDKFCDFMLPNSITAYIRENQGWMDFDSGIIFYNGGMPSTCEWVPVEQTIPLMHRKLDNPRLNMLVNIAGHEQYWWPFYKNYKKDIFDRWEAALRYITERGYKPIWIEDGFFGGVE
ncbi:MAG: hypothetical protein A2283_11235 [Lentisphaerae bacterium RIFOXYA12_FULL_48_11]|nr:MAG: hypothetical protein A2283_11235 [Lentisphaerae bacterium RIFOXYA12_FULL_48_11]